MRLPLPPPLLCAVAVAAVAAASSNIVSGPWSLSQHGTTGVAAMQLAIVSETKAIIYDKVEHNPLTSNSSGGLAWAVEYDITTDAVRVLHPISNSFCAAGAHLSNGTLVNTGGNPVVFAGDLSGLQAIRLFTPCNDGTCDVFEDPTNVRLTSARWYPSAARLDDGSVIIFGGSVAGSFINNPTINNPTYEFYPSKNINGFNGLQIPSPFLKNTLNANHFPIMFELPDRTLFVAANTQAMIFNWRTNVETPLPNIPNGVRVTSPFSAAAVLLPLSPANNYTPEILICGGSTMSDAAPPPPHSVSSQAPASDQCVRMVLDSAGISAGWQVEHMPQPRVMANALLLPDGKVLIVNGAQTGAAGYGNAFNLVGQSNADNPAFQGVYYDPEAPAGVRFAQADMPTSSIARMYHSTATLTPNATVMLAGSNPNVDVSTVKYATEYRVEWLTPSYLSATAGGRPAYTGLPQTVDYGTSFTLNVTLPPGVSSVSVSLMDLGFSTHGTQMDQRMVWLTSALSLPVPPNNATSTGGVLTVQAPPNGKVFPPGPGYIFVVTEPGGVPSFGHETLVGTGAGPPVDMGATRNMLAHTHGQAVNHASQSQFIPVTGEGSEGHGGFSGGSMSDVSNGWI